MAMSEARLSTMNASRSRVAHSGASRLECDGAWSMCCRSGSVGGVRREWMRRCRATPSQSAVRKRIHGRLTRRVARSELHHATLPGPLLAAPTAPGPPLGRGRRFHQAARGRNHCDLFDVATLREELTMSILGSLMGKILGNNAHAPGAKGSATA